MALAWIMAMVWVLALIDGFPDPRSMKLCEFDLLLNLRPGPQDISSRFKFGIKPIERLGKYLLIRLRKYLGKLQKARCS